MLRYVVLHHTGCDTPHYDLMLEQDADGPLTTWRLPHWPPLAGDGFEPIAPHRRAFLEYEGPLTRDRGRVARVAAGRYERIDSTEPSQAIRLMPDGLVLILPV